MERRATAVAACIVLGYAVLVANISLHMKNGGYTQTALRQRQYTVTAGSGEGTIFDRNFVPLVNQRESYQAVVLPTQEGIQAVLPRIIGVSDFAAGIRSGEPFVCEVDGSDISSPDVTVFPVPVRQEGEQPAIHIVGYTSGGEGVTGLEQDYDSVLRGERDTASVTYAVDALGHVLYGEPPAVHPIEKKNAGIVTTLDARIQNICEEEGEVLQKGAVVVMEIGTGDVLAMASFPSFTPDDLESALSSQDSPFINRCLYAYSVGSIFKLVTCAAAYRQGLTHFTADCTGVTEINGQIFHCHDRSGHGKLDMKGAVTVSCNCYFLELSRILDPAVMRETAQDFGFGRQIVLSSGISSMSGTLPTPDQLELPAEMGNFCFGQGFLTASPLQVTQMTCGIAGGGDMPLARLIAGYTLDEKTVENPKQVMFAKSADRNLAYYLQDLMTAAVNANPDSHAAPSNVYAAAKTSTAQTGRYDEEGTEYCHGWITGFFPVEAPRYAVTVLAEDGGYGNEAAAPVFRRITERIMELPENANAGNLVPLVQAQRGSE